MCGITGLINLEVSMPRCDATKIRRMIAMLDHRGPDDTGIYLDEMVGLGHSRLSIIDLEHGKQPIHNETGSVQVVFNGEIFNYPELRKELIKSGHQFYTQTDTEVIVHLYEEYGDRFPEFLNGQFAIALWDRTVKCLYLVRDRTGIVPLFYTTIDNRLYFGSEIKAILAGTQQVPSLDPAALDQVMTFWSAAGEKTVFKNILSVMPGQFLKIDQKGIIKHRYWEWEYPPHGDYCTSSAEEIQEAVSELLIDATQIRLRSDVPVGAYLSGGLDSSVLVALMHHHTDISLRTFSLGFDSDEHDETAFQEILIKSLSADHSRILCQKQAIADTFPEAVWHMETPVLRTAPVPMMHLSGLVHEMGYKVVLTGEGADEVLGGYDIFKEAKIRQFWAKAPQSEFRPLLLKRLYPYLDFTRTQTQAYLKNFFGVGLDTPELPWFSHLPRWQTTAKCKEFFSDNIKQVLTQDVLTSLDEIIPQEMSSWSPFNRAQYLEAKILMPGYLLSSQGDRMLMSHSVEGRFPFLDHRLIEYVNKLDPVWRMKVLNEKYLLKRTMQDIVPAEIIQRYKQPYRAPDIPAFTEPEIPEYVHEMMSPSKVHDYGYFDPDRVRKLFAKVEKGRASSARDSMAFVGILSTQLWHKIFIEDFQYRFRQ